MKKIIALILVLATVFSLSAVAFAEDVQEQQEDVVLTLSEAKQNAIQTLETALMLKDSDVFRAIVADAKEKISAAETVEEVQTIQNETLVKLGGAVILTPQGLISRIAMSIKNLRLTLGSAAIIIGIGELNKNFDNFITNFISGYVGFIRSFFGC